MINGYDIVYGLGTIASSPVWLLRTRLRRKVFRALSQRMGRVPPRAGTQPAVMIHAVSLGEINATRELIRRLRQTRPELQFIVSVTTDTGYARGEELYRDQADVTLVHYPLDFSAAIDRMLDALRPSVVVLLELEAWPNFIARCGKRGIPVLLVNGRITSGSFRRYRLARPLVGRMFRRLHRVCAQDETYAKRFIELGARPARVSVTGTMKFDTAHVGSHVEGQETLAAALGLMAGHRVWVCGSTGPGEEAIALPIYRRLREKFDGLRLVIVPRKPERFDEVAALIEAEKFPLLRRTDARSGEIPAPGQAQGAAPVILGDTIGELRKFYALAEVVFVGRTLVDLGHRQHGSDMIEPAALAKPVVVGPFTGNFAEAMRCFGKESAMRVVRDPQELAAAMQELLSDPDDARAIGQRAQNVVRRQQGATDRHAQLILQALDRVTPAAAARAGAGAV